MRMSPEKDWGANAGLDIARDFMEGGSVRVAHGEITSSMLEYQSQWVDWSMVSYVWMYCTKPPRTEGRQFTIYTAIHYNIRSVFKMVGISVFSSFTTAQLKP